MQAQKKTPVDKTGGEKKAVRWDREDNKKHNPQWVEFQGGGMNKCKNISIK